MPKAYPYLASTPMYDPKAHTLSFHYWHGTERRQVVLKMREDLSEEQVFARFDKDWKQILKVAENSPLIDGAVRLSMT